MKVVWKLDKATVRDVYEALRAKRAIAYTTVMTMMKILEQKGFVDKSEKERAYVYRPTKPERKVMRAMVREFVDRVFNGSAEPFGRPGGWTFAPDRDIAGAGSVGKSPTSPAAGFAAPVCGASATPLQRGQRTCLPACASCTIIGWRQWGQWNASMARTTLTSGRRTLAR